ncbi:MAG TPA: type I-U CRISPR-associated RAMP protein Csb1/Cas7u [Rhizomicrobium sp.]|jgi:CRISPR-associated protein Csb1|nr:type I-U CRISPR-associated RAMP protein Csb1/Cas7u [Rhizomicrobium sp.]
MSKTNWSSLAERILTPDGPAALVCRQWLVPAGSRESAIFPPTFAGEAAGKSKYNIDEIKNGKVALIDSVGSQANRMEPLFKDGDCATLVPQIVIEAGERKINLLDAGHRAADAVVRYTDKLGSDLKSAFLAVRDGDARALAKIAPTSLVFGAWDSRDTQVKLPRLLAATIQAFEVEPLTRSAQYNPALDYVDAGLIDGAEEKKNLDALSELGFRHAPAAGTLGGVIVRGEIKREAILSIVGLRALGPTGKDGENVRRYIFGLALVAMTHDCPHDLRQGCLLVRNPDRAPVWELVCHDGTREAVVPDHSAAIAFAKEAASAFGVGKNMTVKFDRRAANEAVAEKVEAKKPRGKKASP